MRRFYIRPEALNQKIGLISGSDAKHVVKVLRLKERDRLLLFDGNGFDYEAEIVRLSPEKAEVNILRKFPSKSEPVVHITVAQALLKDRKMDDIIRQITELGIFRWIPFPAHRSVSRLDSLRLSSRIERWERIAKESLKQCGRSKIPAIIPVDSFEAMLSLSENSEMKIIFWENETAALTDFKALHERPVQQIFIGIGPEGGFTEEEIERAAACGFQTLSLGPRILKSDTATVAACTLMQYLYGDLGEKLLDKEHGV
ncbi:MAG TPA: 16S rRNA (uracil(1498)-N(3))-methyltransferase [Deltaproteobacteria bacterium]|nr:16S rRNA (uracil(1498)-N(3))-methyltransferase [Deltaproteobacteria bacterium]